jgi:hypothetical protein
VLFGCSRFSIPAIISTSTGYHDTVNISSYSPRTVPCLSFVKQQCPSKIQTLTRNRYDSSVEYLLLLASPRFNLPSQNPARPSNLQSRVELGWALCMHVCMLERLPVSNSQMLNTSLQLDRRQDGPFIRHGIAGFRIQDPMETSQESISQNLRVSKSFCHFLSQTPCYFRCSASVLLYY